MFKWNHDYEYVGLTPGLTPVDGVGAVQRVKGKKEWSGKPVVQFQPPRGVAPAVAGTLVDGKADPADIGAMMIDLSLRKWFRIDKEGEEFVFFPCQQQPNDILSEAEADLLNVMFPGRSQRVTMRELKPRLRQHIRPVTDQLYSEMTTRGWYERDPRNRGFLGLAGRAVRTADGTAVRIQLLGFREYLATAEADQIKFEEAAGLFSRYLPYAMIFGLAERWAKVIGEVAKEAELAGYGNIFADVMSDPFFWLFFGDDMFMLAGELVGGIGDLVGSLGDIVDVGDMVGGLGDILGDVGDSLGDLFDF